jgi:hypothetical protein
VIEDARTACFNSGQRIEDHFVEVTDMIEIGKGGRRPVKTVMLSRYACYLAILARRGAKILLVAARDLPKTVPKELKRAWEENRLMILSPLLANQARSSA